MAISYLQEISFHVWLCLSCCGSGWLCPCSGCLHWPLCSHPWFQKQAFQKDLRYLKSSLGKAEFPLSSVYLISWQLLVLLFWRTSMMEHHTVLLSPPNTLKKILSPNIVFTLCIPSKLRSDFQRVKYVRSDSDPSGQKIMYVTPGYPSRSKKNWLSQAKFPWCVWPYQSCNVNTEAYFHSSQLSRRCKIKDQISTLCPSHLGACHRCEFYQQILCFPKPPQLPEVYSG